MFVQELKKVLLAGVLAGVLVEMMPLPCSAALFIECLTLLFISQQAGVFPILCSFARSHRSQRGL